MPGREGFTLIEVLVVLFIIGIIAAFYFPNFTTPNEQAWASNAQNNLLAIYSAEQNYKNNNGSYATSASLPAINSTLALNIQDDGTYSYSCSGGVTCTATRNTVSSTNIVITLATGINLSGSGTANPVCNTSNHWCP